MTDVLVTGGDGYLGTRVRARLDADGYATRSLDAPESVLDPFADMSGDWCIHLAAHKHAPYGEDFPAEVAETNIEGTANVVRDFGPRVVLASTCKAADPMTVYGASKLIAERIVLNAGGRVVRLVNVYGSSGSVVDIWDQIPEGEPLPVARAWRHWMAAEFAVALFVKAMGWPSGRYAPDVRGSMPMKMFAGLHYPGRETVEIPLRRGDRQHERLIGEYERPWPWEPGVIRIEHPADAPASAEAPTDARRAP